MPLALLPELLPTVNPSLPSARIPVVMLALLVKSCESVLAVALPFAGTGLGLIDTVWALAGGRIVEIAAHGLPRDEVLGSARSASAAGKPPWRTHLDAGPHRQVVRGA